MKSQLNLPTALPYRVGIDMGTDIGNPVRIIECQESRAAATNLYL